MKFIKYSLLVALGAVAVSCSNDDPVLPEPEGTVVEGATPGDGGAFRGFYVLNEGNMGANKCTLDYYSFRNATYTRNIYSAANPNEILELGDAGSDLAVYGDYLYIVVSGSHKVEVLDAATAKKVAQINISSPRNIAFSGDYAYVTSWVGGDGDNGSLVRFSTRDFVKIDSVSVGRMPEGLTVYDSQIFVANTGDYENPEYKNYISVVDVAPFAFKGNISAPVNLQYISFDSYNRLWVSSRGNYNDKPSCLADFVKRDGAWYRGSGVQEPISNMSVTGTEILYIGTTYDAQWNPSYTYGTIDLGAESYVKGGSFITDGSEKDIKTPYALAVNPDTHAIVVTDAKNYVSSGTVYYYSHDGKLQWKVTAGDIPGHIAFVK